MSETKKELSRKQKGALLIGIVGLSLLSGLGYIFMLDGNEIITGILVIVTAAFFFVMVKALVQQKTKARNTSLSIAEMVLLTIYALGAIASSIAVSHALNIEQNVKSDIKEYGKLKSEEINDMLVTYEKDISLAVQIHRAKLGDLADKYRNGGITKSEFESSKTKLSVPEGYSRRDIKSKLDLLCDSYEDKLVFGISDLKENNAKFINRTGANLVGWSRLKIIPSLKAMNEKVEADFNFYKTKMGETYSHIPKAVKNFKLDDPKTLFAKSSPNWILLALIIGLLHFLILIPYIVVDRVGFSPKYKRGESIGREI